MRILVIGKYPPIEGGVSSTTYWMSRILAEEGHEVHVVTNADSVEWQYKMWLQDEDLSMLEMKPGDGSSGSVRLHRQEERVNRGAYIPWANPFVSQLTGLALRAIKEHGCDLIYSHYLEPYGVAAMLVANLTGIPYAVRHAGSDMGRLALVSSLREIYKQVLKRAAAVVTPNKSHFERLKALGATEQNLLLDPVYSIPTDCFSPKALPLDVAAILSRTQQWTEGIGYPSLPAEKIQSINRESLEAGIPAVGMYGKMGEAKGTFDLLRAMRKDLRARKAYLLMMINGPILAWEELFCRIEELEIARQVRLLPFLPHWRVPSFIRACRLVCFLERRFSITFHSPVIPREVLACSTALICSQEIIGKCSFKESVVSGRNMFVLNPEDEGSLADAISGLLEDEQKARTVGYEGLNLSSVLENPALYRSSRTGLMQQVLANVQSR